MNQEEKTKSLIEFWKEKQDMYRLKSDKHEVYRCQRHIDIANGVEVGPYISRENHEN